MPERRFPAQFSTGCAHREYSTDRHREHPVRCWLCGHRDVWTVGDDGLCPLCADSFTGLRVPRYVTQGVTA